MITSAADHVAARGRRSRRDLVLGKPHAEEALLFCIAKAQAVGEAVAA